MFRIKSFQRRILFALLAVALVPTVVFLLAGVLALREVVDMTGTAGPWGSLAESGQSLLLQVEEAELENPDIAAAAEIHQEALAESLRYSRIFSLLANRFMGRLPLLALTLALAMIALSFWAARQLSRGFSRPIRDLVGWTDIIARNEPLPPADQGGHRGVQEFSLLREALRKMASELEDGRRGAIQAAKLRSWTEMGRRVAHELKNPLTPMRMAAATISRMEGDSAQRAGAVLLEEIARLDEMARTFSQFGRMPEGPPAEVDITELLEGLIRQHQNHGTETSEGPDIELEAIPELPLIHGHYDALLRAFRNLLMNGVDAAGADGKVFVRLQEGPDGVRVEIQDTGPGIPPGDEGRIWEPEFTTKSQGTGLGLPMVRQTIEFHHGRVYGRNHPDGGAIFSVELPKEGVLAAPGANPEPSPDPSRV